MEACEWQEEAPASCAEGYYPVRKGEMFSGRYHVVQNLGCGYFSTVWLCQDVGKKKCVAVKVPKGGEDFAEAALDEVMLLRYVNSKRRKDQAGDHVIRLLDDFKMIGENGFHVCLVFELLGPSLQVLLSSQGAQGLPPPFLKKAMQQVLKGLYFLHKECRIIHADIKPENILLHVTEASLQTLLHNMVSLDYSTGVEPKRPGGDMAALLDCCNLMKMGVKIADLGSACWTAFELATGKRLFEPQAGQCFSRDDDHVARIIELLGKIPPKMDLFWKQASPFFRRQGALLRMSWISSYDLYHTLTDKYSWPKHQAAALASFLLPMLEYAPEKRATAEKCLQHPWLNT
ncbi:SRSF protein kinase 1-like isoform X3 [Hemicordylus capensis]|uniref:SRSF protein kinase 1-like isoform X3 n=1 Tax=Hemicordylus capensis TaxID=884348 RepID=UPI002304111D|nr:SRSF protein kinase 1-like isoform X3 [Hemicordylus capensis]